MNRRQCVIFSSRPVEPEMKALIQKDAFIIAADAGYLQARTLGIEPDLIVGDFDSAPVPDFPAEVCVLPAEKDDTDTRFAVKKALEKGFSQLLLLGAEGGRLDHTYANLQTLLFIAKSGGRGCMASAAVQCYCFGPGSLVLPRSESWVSVFTPGERAEGVCLKGLKYPLDQAVLTHSFPLGASNEFAAPEAEITCSSGYLYVMVTPK